MSLIENVEFKELHHNDIKLDMLKKFNRYQEVSRCWRKENQKWVLKNISFIEQWDNVQKEKVIESFARYIEHGGKVFGVYIHNQLVGFASLDNNFFGSAKEYVQLGMLHISNEYRNQGVGKKLFLSICDQAKRFGAKKLYISAHSSEATQAFYKAVGCIEAEEINQKLADEEPSDCQLEYTL